MINWDDGIDWETAIQSINHDINHDQNDSLLLPSHYTMDQLINTATVLHPFDPKSISSWLYPTNLPIREYQFNIVQKALFFNTLVSIPTGMGKTFIAAVVMVNYYRWFPESKIIFLAPTRPLTSQQQEACSKITGIPLCDQVIFVGTDHNATARKEFWIHKRIVFCTPQIMQNDLSSGICPANKIVCVVVDEAHRSTGNYAYVNVIRELHCAKSKFRVLALSATPGSRKQQVQEIVTNLHINHIEIRTEDSIDLRKYFFNRNIDTTVVPINDTLNSIRVQFMDFARPIIMRLSSAKAIQHNSLDQLHPYIVQMARTRILNQPGGSGSFGHLFPDFAALHKLASIYDTLVYQSIRAFNDEIDSLNQWLESSKKPPRPIIQLIGSMAWKQFVAYVKSIIQDPKFTSHPKLDKLGSILLDHFVCASNTTATSANGFGSDVIGQNKGLTESKVIVFAKYRAIVEEISSILQRHSPIIRPITFVGQSKAKSGERGLKQREQLAVLQRFQKGSYNVLVSTSVGEEGLDIGEVDLIVCYDSSQSPIQMLQRMGRTSRKRQGRVVLLLSQGREEQSYKKSQSQYKNVQAFIGNNTNGIEFAVDVPRMLPAIVKPVCIQLQFSIPEEDHDPSNGLRRRQSDQVGQPSVFLSPDETVDFVHRFAMHPNDPPLPLPLSLSKHLQKQILRRGGSVEASLTSLAFFDILKFNSDINIGMDEDSYMSVDCLHYSQVPFQPISSMSQVSDLSLNADTICKPPIKKIPTHLVSNLDSSPNQLDQYLDPFSSPSGFVNLIHSSPNLSCITPSTSQHQHVTSKFDLNLSYDFDHQNMDLKMDPIVIQSPENGDEINWTPIDMSEFPSTLLDGCTSNVFHEEESLPYYITGKGIIANQVPVCLPDLNLLLQQSSNLVTSVARDQFSPNLDNIKNTQTTTTLRPEVSLPDFNFHTNPNSTTSLSNIQNECSSTECFAVYKERTIDYNRPALLQQLTPVSIPLMPPLNTPACQSWTSHQATPVIPNVQKTHQLKRRLARVEIPSENSNDTIPVPEKKSKPQGYQKAQLHKYVPGYLDLEASLSGTDDASSDEMDECPGSLDEWVDDRIVEDQPNHFYRSITSVVHENEMDLTDRLLQRHCRVQTTHSTPENCDSYDSNDSFLASSSGVVHDNSLCGTLDILESKLDESTSHSRNHVVSDSQLSNLDQLNSASMFVSTFPTRNRCLVLDSPEVGMPLNKKL